MVRCKFVLRHTTKTYNNDGSISGTRFDLEAVQDQSIPENQAFTKYTPCGNLSVHISNPAAVEALEKGGGFYLDLTPVEGQ